MVVEACRRRTADGTDKEPSDRTRSPPTLILTSPSCRQACSTHSGWISSTCV